MRSTGIVEEVFDVKGQKLRVFDVGGQRSERKKWIHCFDSVVILIFVVAISEYDQTLYEDESVNRLAEATMLFESLAGSRWFERSSFVLLFVKDFPIPSATPQDQRAEFVYLRPHRLNKIDLFEEKLRRQPASLREWYPDYVGPEGDVPSACTFMRAKFVALNTKKDRPFYVHLTCVSALSLHRSALSRADRSFDTLQLRCDRSGN